MKILIVHNSYRQFGGEDVVFRQESELLKRAGHRVITYLRHNSEEEKYRGLGRVKLLSKVIWARDTQQEIKSLLGREKPDLVHVHNTFVMVSPSVFSACREAGIPVVMTLHNYRLYCPAATFFRDGHICEECVDHSLWSGIGHGCYRGSHAATAAVALMLAVHRQRQTWSREVDYCIALTQFARGRFIRAGFPAPKVLVKPNFVHPDPGVRDDSGDYAVFVGRLSPEKRLNTTLAAWTRLSKSIPLFIVGGGPQRAELEGQALRSGLRRITFLGHLPREEALAVIRGARLMIFCSEWYENFPVTIIESFACGVPVIGSRLGAMKEIVEDGRTGLLFSPGDAGDLADTVERAWGNQRLMASMSAEARQEYENKYTAAKNYPLLMDIYRRTLGGRIQVNEDHGCPQPHGAEVALRQLKGEYNGSRSCGNLDGVRE
jgi:glycosyltransferase involved in cell wall biosynthesis